MQWLSTAAVLGTAACGPTTEPAPAAPAPSTSASAVTAGFNPLPAGIDWRMEDRFPRDTNGDGVREERFDPDYLRPPSYTVTLIGCPADAANYTYQWIVNGVPEAGPCFYTRQFPAQGAYDVKLRVTQGTQTAEYPRTVVVKDWLIFSLGDSYGSGEGAPDLTRAQTNDDKPRWADPLCHRSFNSPSARAALALEESDPHSSVTYVSLACSGATISRDTYEGFALDTFVKAGTCGSSTPCPRQGSGLLGNYVGIEKPEQPWHDPEDYIKPQVEAMAMVVGIRPIDALVISGGGNDVGFGDILQLCVVAEGACNDMGLFGSGQKLHTEADPLIAALPSRYDALATRLAEVGVNVRRTYLMEYPDLMHNESGNICDEILEGTWMFGSVTKNELQHLEGYVQVPLLNMMHEAAARHGWNYVKDISRAFSGQDGSGVGHGMCVPSWLRWINPSQDADETQGGGKSKTTGKAHPNTRGFQVMADKLLASIRATQPELVPERTVLRAYNTAPVYIVLSGAKLWVPTWDYLYSNYGLTEADVREVPQSVLDALPDHAWNSILKKYEYLGGAGGPLGPLLPSPQGDERTSPDGQGHERHFTSGAIYARTGQAEYAVYGAIYPRYRDMGGVQSWLGWPTADEVAIGNGYVRQRFQNGTVYSSGAGLILLRAQAQKLYEDLGDYQNGLGYPTAGGTTYDGGEYTEFGTYGLISWHPLLGANVVYGDIYAKYRAMGRWTGPLGLPVSNELDDPGAGAGGRMSKFLFGTIHWVPGHAWEEMGPYSSGHRFFPMDYDGDGDKDFVVRGPHGQFMLYRTEAGQFTFAGILANTNWADSGGWNSGHRFFVMDVDGDGDDDLVSRDAFGNFSLLRSDRSHLWYAGVMLQHPGMADQWGWNDGHRYFVLDLNGDGKDDLLARDSAGTFYGMLSDGTHLTGGSVFYADQGLADWNGWNQGLRFFPMDYDGDGDDDLVLRDVSGNFYSLRSERSYLTWGGTLYSNAGMADQWGWNDGNRYYVMDFDGDRDDDLLLRDSAGTFFLLKGQGNSLAPVGVVYGSPYSDGSGWNTPNRFFVMDLDKDGDDDLVGRQADGRLITFRSDRTSMTVTGYGIDTPLVDGPWLPPPPPPPDPCETDPASCEDPCTLDPASCQPDPCDAKPWLCDPMQM